MTETMNQQTQAHGGDAGEATPGSEASVQQTPTAEAFDQFFTDIARIIIDEMREMVKRGEMKRVKVKH